MKIINKVLSVSLAAVMLFGCSAQKTAYHYTPIEKIEAGTQETLPVISIETKSKDANVMDFITEPVAQHVAEDIASWTEDYEIPPAPYYEECSISVKDGKGTVVLDSADAKVKVRGNWTTTYDKKPLKIKFSEKQSMLGLNGGAEQKSWLLLAEYKDASMLRNKAALYASRGILGADGLYAADCDLVEVEVNGEYQGIYLLSDTQQVSSSRVNITEPEKDYTGTDIGYLLEYDGYFTNEDELHSFPLDLADNARLRVYDGNLDEERYMNALKITKTDRKKPVGITIKSTVNSQEQHDFIENFVNNVYTIMYEAAYNNKAYVFDADYKDITETSDITPQQAVENVVNVQSLVDMYIISELTCDADIYWSSFYMDVDFGPDGSKKLTFEAPWDFDSAMGNKDRCIDGTGFYASNVIPDVNGGTEFGGYDTINPWLVVLAYQDWYQDMIKKTWTKAYDNKVLENTCKLVADDAAKYQDEFTKNYEKWNNIVKNGAFVNELSEPAKACKTQLEAAEFLLTWLNNRIDFLNKQWHE